MRSARAPWLLVAAATLAGLSGCVLSEDERIDRELAAGDFALVTTPLTGDLETPATFSFAAGSTVHLADNRFDSFEIEGLLRASITRRCEPLGLTPVASGGRYRLGYLVTADDGAMVEEAMATIGLPAPADGAPRPLPRGTLVLALGAPGSRDLLWRGSLEGAIDPESDPGTRQERVDLAVAALLRELEGAAGGRRP